jgi:hypothetical protein
MGNLIIGPAAHNDKVAWRAAINDQSEPQFFIFSGENEALESSIFDGSYPGLRRFYDHLLPYLRDELFKLLDGNGSAKIYMGAEIGTLYAAYYCAVMGRRYSLELVDPQFLGGKNVWAQQHPLLLNKLISTALCGAFEVKIVGQEHFERLPKAFPRIDREYLLSDLVLDGNGSEDGLGLPPKDDALV